jgi:hypothetical protein
LCHFSEKKNEQISAQRLGRRALKWQQIFTYLVGWLVGWLVGLLRHAIENMHSPLLDLETIFKENAPELNMQI